MRAGGHYRRMAAQLKVTLATISRFHSFEVAGELARRGALAAIFTGLARHFVRHYPLPRDSVRTFPWFQTPLEAAQRLRLLPRRWEQAAAWHAKEALDRHVAGALPDCHVYCALSGVGRESGRAARARGIVHVCDRSSSHIVFQDRILQAEYDRLGLPFAGIDPRVIEKECAEYTMADAVIVPSGFAQRSFVAMGFPEAKLHRIPLGVELSAFRRCAPPDTGFRILFTGELSVRKGLHYLLQAVARAAIPDATLVLVGPKCPETDVLLKRFPVSGLKVTGPLPRADVALQMSRASVLVLPSVEDGFGMVMAQALACGCPVIASSHTGGADLFADGGEGFLVPACDAEALAARLVRLRDDPALRDAMAERAVARVRELGGWDTYGRAAAGLFESLARAAGHDVAVPPDPAPGA